MTIKMAILIQNAINLSALVVTITNLSQTEALLSFLFNYDKNIPINHEVNSTSDQSLSLHTPGLHYVNRHDHSPCDFANVSIK